MRDSIIANTYALVLMILYVLIDDSAKSSIAFCASFFFSVVGMICSAIEKNDERKY